MFQNKRLTRAAVIGIAGLMMCWSSTGRANDRNFKAAASQSGCQSLITREGIEACQRIQAAKNAACNRSAPCELDKQEEAAKAYAEFFRWWETEGSKLPDNDFKRDKQRQMTDLVAKLVNRRQQANDGVIVATGCIRARNDVQKWFEDVAIPLTARTKVELLPIRRALVDKFNETKARREDAKKKYDDKPTDDGLRKDWEAARDANIQAGQRLDEFDKTYGPDIEYYHDKLISHYNAEKTNHDTPSAEAEKRLAKCEKTVNVEWKPLPF